MKSITGLMILSALFLGACDDDPDQPIKDQGVVVDMAVPQWAPAFAATDEGGFLSVWGSGASDIWTVGGDPDLGVAWRFDGSAWLKVELPAGPGLNWVNGAGGTLWMVGHEGRILRKVGEGALEAVDSPVRVPLWGVWAVSADEAWAVGGEAREDGTDADPVVIHWDGTAWTRAELPMVAAGVRAIFKVWGTAADNIYAVGAKGVILHWDGTAWAAQDSGTEQDLVSLWGRSADEIIVVGGRASGVIARKTAGGWDPLTIPGQPGFNGVWMDADGLSWVAGNRGLLVTVRPASFAVERQVTNTQEILHGVWSPGNGHTITVGGSLDLPPPWEGVVLELGRP